MLDAPLISLLEVFELIALASLGACTVWLAVRSLPQALIERQKRVEAIVATLSTRVAEFADERVALKVQYTALGEEVENYLGQIERKRSSTAAAASRIAGVQALAGPPNVASMSRSDQIAHLRRQTGG